MHTKEKTEALVTQLEGVLWQLETENGELPWSCCVCFQDVPSKGHLPGCYLAKALKDIDAWRQEVAEEEPVSHC